MEYNYVIYINDWDLMRCCFDDLKDRENVRVVPFSGYADGYRGRLYNLYASLYRRIKFAWPSIVMPLFVDGWHFDQDRPICFVFSALSLRYLLYYNLIPVFRRRYPGCKIVWYLEDLVNKYFVLHENLSNHALIDIDKVRGQFDLIASFDPGDVNRYGLSYYPMPYSRFDIGSDAVTDYDVYFCGMAKNRHHDLMLTYRALKDAGLSVRFHITHSDKVPDAEKVQAPDIIYGKPISYYQILKEVAKAKCVLEILQKNSTGNTLRTYEAVVYNKFLLSNNPLLVNDKFYDPRYMSVFNTNDHVAIDPGFLSKIRESGPDSSPQYDYSNQLSPINFIAFLENHL